MTAYVVRRVLIAVPTLWAITVLAFALLSLAPGDAVDALVLSRGQGRTVLSGADLQNLKHQYGLDQPLPVRYVVWLEQVLRGNFGFRVADGYSVGALVADRLPRTLELMGAALLIGLLAGLPLGTYSALRPYSMPDYVLTIFAFIGVSIPSFFAAIAALYIFGVWLQVLPVSGYVTPGRAPSLLEELYHLVLPAAVLSLQFVAGFMRYVRASFLEVLREDYITTARGKGLKERVILVRHAFRNGVLPIITIIGLSLPNLIAGAVIIESFFNWPGLGQLYFTAIGERDYPSMMAMVILSGTIVLLSSLLADLAYAIADPRIRYGS